MSTELRKELQSLEHSAIIELFELDATAQGAPEKLFFHAGTNGLGNPIVWQGITYSPYAIEATGFEWSGNGKLPRPKMRVANVFGEIGAYADQYDNLYGARVTRRKTHARFLDIINFPSGNPNADPTQCYPDEVWFVSRKSTPNRIYVEFELASPFDLVGVMLPGRQYIANCCPWIYRSAECSYAGGAVADSADNTTDANGIPVTLANDMCGGRLKSCKLRFGEFAELPYGGFPGVGLVQ